MKEASDGVARNRRCWVWVGFIQLLELYVVLIVSPDLEQQANMRNVKQRYFCIGEFVLHHNEMQKPQDVGVLGSSQGSGQAASKWFCKDKT